MGVCRVQLNQFLDQTQNSQNSTRAHDERQPRAKRQSEMLTTVFQATLPPFELGALFEIKRSVRQGNPSIRCS